LLDYRSRWYDPQLGRFNQPDTIIPDDYSPQSLNRYAYALNNPVRYNDPTGHCVICLVVIGAVTDFLVTYGPIIVATFMAATWLTADSTHVDTDPEQDKLVYETTLLLAPLAFPAFANDPASIARLHQGTAEYPGVDDWQNTTIKKGTTVWAGAPGQSPFYTDNETIATAGNNATEIFEGLQVTEGEYGQFRPGMTAYTVTEDTPAASSQALANPDYGVGGFLQYFIPNYKNVLQPFLSIALKDR
jgi:hypothetical protein